VVSYALPRQFPSPIALLVSAMHDRQDPPHPRAVSIDIAGDAYAHAQPPPRFLRSQRLLFRDRVSASTAGG
jgi:hypothetical protein